MLNLFKYGTREKCLICNKPIGLDDWIWYGLDGDKIHKECKIKEYLFYSKIDNMSDEEFSNWLKGNL